MTHSDDLREEIIDKVETISGLKLDDILDFVNELYDEETEEALARYKAKKGIE